MQKPTIPALQGPDGLIAQTGGRRLQPPSREMVGQTREMDPASGTGYGGRIECDAKQEEKTWPEGREAPARGVGWDGV